MAHIQLPEDQPGIVGPLAFGPETAKPLLELTETLLRGPNTLTPNGKQLADHGYTASTAKLVGA